MKAAKPNKAATRRPYSKKKLLQKSPTAPLNATRAVRGGKKKKKRKHQFRSRLVHADPLLQLYVTFHSVSIGTHILLKDIIEPILL